MQEMESQRKWLWSRVGECVFLIVRLWLYFCVKVTNAGVIQQNIRPQAEAEVHTWSSLLNEITTKVISALLPKN